MTRKYIEHVVAFSFSGAVAVACICFLSPMEVQCEILALATYVAVIVAWKS